MMKKMKFLLILLSISLSGFSQSKKEFELSSPEKMKWFNEAKLGIFIHWGIYAVNGTSESWAFFNDSVPYDKYMNQINGFTAKNYKPEEWAKLFKEAGAKYAVLTTKHHDGVALWDTKLSDLNVVKKSPAGRDLIKPFCEALNKEGIKTGLYFSHLDWSHPDYASVVPPYMIFNENRNKFAYPAKGSESIFKWEKFLLFHRGQIKELCTTFNPDLLWFDGTWERDTMQWKMRQLRDSINKWSPKTILNSRMQGYGDYDTPEQSIPIVRPKHKWELCITMNDSWGYRQQDLNFKPTIEIVRTFVECLGNGGNLLLDIGPKEDGIIPDQMVKTLKELGAWIKRNEPSVYSTVAGLPYGHFFGHTTLNPEKSIIYLYLFDKPIDYLTLKGIRNNIKSIKVLGTGETLTWKRSGGADWLKIPGITKISAPKTSDPFVTVIAVELDGKLDLYHGAGHAADVY